MSSSSSNNKLPVTVQRMWASDKKRLFLKTPSSTFCYLITESVFEEGSRDALRVKHHFMLIHTFNTYVFLFFLICILFISLIKVEAEIRSVEATPLIHIVPIKRLLQD